jgi:hypothetical protein
MVAPPRRNAKHINDATPAISDALSLSPPLFFLAERRWTPARSKFVFAVGENVGEPTVVGAGVGANVIIWIEDLSKVTVTPAIPAVVSELAIAVSIPSPFNVDTTAVATDESVVVTVAFRDSSSVAESVTNMRARSLLTFTISSETVLASTESVEATAFSYVALLAVKLAGVTPLSLNWKLMVIGAGAGAAGTGGAGEAVLAPLLLLLLLPLLLPLLLAALLLAALLLAALLLAALLLLLLLLLPLLLPLPLPDNRRFGSALSTLNTARPTALQ